MGKLNLFLDLDGPILDVSERYFRVHEDVVRSFENRCLADRDEYWKMKRSRKALGEILEKFSERQVSESAFLQEWLKRIESPEYLKLDKLIPGVKKQLYRLKERLDLVLVTLRRNQDGLGDQLRHLDLSPFFSHVLSATPMRSESWKVKRDLIASSGLLSAGNWIIGDSEVDILAGKALGMKTIAVLSGIRNSAVLKEVAPDFIVEDLNHLPCLD